jgi:esterase/lipase
MPVLLQWGKNDRRVSTAETNAIFKNLASKNKKLVVYEDSGHESYCNREIEKWKTEVKAFLANP